MKSRHLERTIGRPRDTNGTSDIAVWDRDMYSIPASDIKNLKCEMTIFSGQVVYKAAATPITVQNALPTTNAAP